MRPAKPSATLPLAQDSVRRDVSLEGTLGRWAMETGAEGAAAWWLSDDRLELQARVAVAEELTALLEREGSWLVDLPEDSLTTLPAWTLPPTTPESRDEEPGSTLRHALALGGVDGGRALVALFGSKQVEDKQTARLAELCAAEATALVREIERSHLLRAAARREAEHNEERRIFFAGRVVVFKWRNEPGWPVDYVSPNVEEVLGYDATDWLESRISYAEVLHQEDVTRVTEEVQAAVAEGCSSFTHQDYRVVRSDGSVRWLYDHTSLVRDADGNVSHFLGYILDVTERRVGEEERLALESKMQQAQKLESLGVLTGGLAHDFNNLLVGVLGNADLARAEIPPDSEASHHLESIELAARRAADLVRQMLAYSGKGRFHIESVDLREVIQEMSHLLDAAISKKVLLRFQFDDEAPILNADVTQIRQVVMNLITNASDAIGTRNGLVTLRTGRRHCTAEFLAQAQVAGAVEAGEHAFLEVCDTGRGMDAKTQEMIFDPFYTTKFAGRGLGLAAVQGIVRGHNGALFLKSSPGGGTTFQLYFPLCSKAPRDPRGEQERDQEDRLVVLLVDDEEAVRSVARKMLERRGLEVVIAKDGDEALETFRASPLRFDLALVDLTMPGLGGMDCLAEMRRIRPDLRAILSSGYTEPSEFAEGRDSESTCFLQKPYDSEQLAEAVSRLIAAL